MDWTKKEVILIVADYFDMLSFELSGKKYNKLAHRRALTPLLNNRYNSIEFKHRNISGILVKLGLPFIKGYKPLFNYQHILEDEVIRLLTRKRSSLEKEFIDFSEEEIQDSEKKLNFNSILDKSPAKSKISNRDPSFSPIKTNYLLKEQNNRQLGENGEKLVIEYEKWRLIKAGKETLADKIEWISKEKGDGMGFDILSKNNNGTDRFIEVKTTKLSKETPIFLSNNELKFSNLNAVNFFLYRVFNFSESPKIFIKKGKYDGFCVLQPHIFKGYF